MSENPIFQRIEKQLADQGFTFERKDMERPWGGFWVIDESLAFPFIETYFPNVSPESLIGQQKLSPKILLVAPDKRLSWQYHYRRKEIWRVIEGRVGVIRSATDEQTDMITYEEGEDLSLDIHERHRLIGLEDWGVVAEIWMHTDPNHPSDENDIVRLQDDFKRKTPV